jgi:hypothetical protein
VAHQSFSQELIKFALRLVLFGVSFSFIQYDTKSYSHSSLFFKEWLQLLQVTQKVILIA